MSIQEEELAKVKPGKQAPHEKDPSNSRQV
jgi:hypothetical protein